MIVHDDGISYRIFDSEVKFYADDTAYGWNVVAEYNNNYYHLGSESVGIELAVSFWQNQNDKILSQDELKQIMIDNQLIAERKLECHGSSKEEKGSHEEDGCKEDSEESSEETSKEAEEGCGKEAS
jgi:hypothetical protein